MRLWLDAQLSPALARWITETFEGLEAIALRDLGLRDSEDVEIFEAARSSGAIVVSKDSDFLDMFNRLGPPPQVIWIRCGNTSNAQMRRVLTGALPAAIALLSQGEPLVEIAGP